MAERLISRVHPSERAFRSRHASPFSRRPISLLDRTGATVGPRVQHLANFNRNAGDALVGVALRDLLSQESPRIDWRATHIHKRVNSRRLRQLNRSNGVVIGGGGLLLRDTNPNHISGWQWPCGPDAIRRLTPPVLVFAIGYNRFRDQPDFLPVFDESIAALVTHSEFFSLRNRGSIDRLCEHLPSDLHDRLTLQPCPTSVITEIYPEVVEALARSKPKRTVVGFNCAFDRPALRFGPPDAERESVLQIVHAMRRLLDEAEVVYMAHTPSDEHVLRYLADDANRIRCIRLYRQDPLGILQAYCALDLMIGMRGHAQLVPFGCGVPILSIVSHPKIRYFLDDISRTDLGRDVADPELADALVASASQILADPLGERLRLAEARRALWETTRANVRRISRIFT